MMFETERLMVRRIGIADAGFMLALLNDPGFLANIGDRGVRTIEDAARYVTDRVLASYDTYGFGMYRVAVKEGDRPIGIVGLVRREGLDGPDLGFAYLAGETGRGYGYEAGQEMIGRARSDLGMTRLLAVTAPHNAASVRLLLRLGFVERAGLVLPGQAQESRLFERR